MIKIAFIGAGSQSFGPRMIRDVLLSEPLARVGVELVLMDTVADHLTNNGAYAQYVRDQLKRQTLLSITTDVRQALDGAAFVICAIERDRWARWSEDFHIPRLHGSSQIFGENGGPGGIFHALRNIGPMLEIATAMSALCPQAWLLNFSNPEHKLCEAISRATRIRSLALCHGVFMGMHQISMMLGIPLEELDTAACGLNHFTWFQRIVHKRTGEDLYPLLRAKEREADWLCQWHELALGRILFRRFGLWPSPGGNHYGEYIRWAHEFVPAEAQFFYDPRDGHPWHTGDIPTWHYTIDKADTARAWGRPQPPAARPLNAEPLTPSAELAVPIIEAVGLGLARHLEAVTIVNNGAMPDMPVDAAVEVPAQADAGGVHPCRMAPMPEAIAAMLRLQTSINKLTVEAFLERSKEKLLQALLLDPTVDSYRGAVAMMEALLDVQKDYLPTFA
jgi:alpha-galactosidase